MKTTVICYCVLINVVAFMLMGIDKRRARLRKFRIPEKTLFLPVIIGGSVGGLLGMYVFRHKTRHVVFVIGYWLLLILHAAAVFLYIKNCA